MPLWRSQQQNVYHTCQRCGFRQPLAKMVWQNGLLVCSPTNCQDTEIIGSHDLRVAKAVAVNRHELQADEKLTNPIARKNDLAEVLF